MSTATIERPSSFEDRGEPHARSGRQAEETAVERPRTGSSAALEWLGNKAKQAWNWFTGTVSGGAKWVKERAIATFNWAKVNGKKAWAKAKEWATRAWNWGWEALQWGWTHGKTAVLWMSKPARIVLGLPDGRDPRLVTRSEFHCSAQRPSGWRSSARQLPED